MISLKRIIYIIFLLLSIASIAQADGEWEARRQEQQKTYDNLLHNLPLEKANLRDILRLNVENRMLILRTSIPSTQGDGYSLANLPKLKKPALVRIQSGTDKQTNPVIPTNFQFTINDYSVKNRITTLSISEQQNYITISKSCQFPEGYSNIQFIERMGDNDRSAQLIISENGIKDEPSLNINIETSDFFVLLNNYPDECHLWLRPLLREIDQENVMAPDPMIVWQVFSDQWKSDVKIQRQIKELILQLDDDDYRIRENATLSLEKFGRDGALVIMYLNRQNMTNEQRARIDRILSNYIYLTPTEIIYHRRDLVFLIDCLYCNDSLLRKAAFSLIKEWTNTNIQFDVNSNEETRAEKIAFLRKELTNDCR
jgi:hypothetical protein